MAQHFLLSRRAKDLSIGQVMKMTDAEVEMMYRQIRWSNEDGAASCPHCGCFGRIYETRRPSGMLRFRCGDCRGDFSLTSGTIFSSRKLPLRSYLLAIVIFCNEVKGKNALALSRDLGVSYKAAFVLAHKMREAMAEELKGAMVGGEGKDVEVDGLYVGGYVKPANRKEDRKDRRKVEHKRDKRRVVVSVRERNGRIVSTVAKSESDGVAFIRDRVMKGTTVHADEAGAWNVLAGRFAMRRINHQEAYRDETNTNAVESFFSRIRRGEAGHFHHISGPYLLRYAQEAGWREDRRRDSNGEQARAVLRLALAARPSADFAGYWQRAARA